MNRPIKDPTLRAFNHDDIESLKAHTPASLKASNLAKHLKALWWRAPDQAT